MKGFLSIHANCFSAIFTHRNKFKKIYVHYIYNKHLQAIQKWSDTTFENCSKNVFGLNQFFCTKTC